MVQLHAIMNSHKPASAMCRSYLATASCGSVGAVQRVFSWPHSIVILQKPGAPGHVGEAARTFDRGVETLTKKVLRTLDKMVL